MGIPPTVAHPHQDTITVSRYFRILVGDVAGVNALAEKLGAEPTQARVIALGVCENGGPAYDLVDLIEALTQRYPDAGERLVGTLQHLLDSFDPDTMIT